MKHFILYIKYIIPLMSIGVIIDLIFINPNYDFFKYIGGFVGSMIATNIIYKDKKNSP